MKIARINGMIACCAVATTVEQSSAQPRGGAPLTPEEISRARGLAATVVQAAIKKMLTYDQSDAVTITRTTKGPLIEVRCDETGGETASISVSIGKDGSLARKFSEGMLELISEIWYYEQGCHGEWPSAREILNRFIAEEANFYGSRGLKTYRAVVTKDGKGIRAWLSPIEWRAVLRVGEKMAAAAGRGGQYQEIRQIAKDQSAWDEASAEVSRD